MTHVLVLSVGFGLVTASVLALAAVGVTLQFGVTNYINFAYGSYMALGAYIAWILNQHFGANFWLAVVLGAACIALLAVAMSRFILQPFARRSLPRVYMLIVTLGLWLLLSNLVLAIWGPNPRQFSVGAQSLIAVGPFLLSAQQLLILGAAVVVLAAVHLLLTQTNLGKAMRAMSDDPSLAEVSGIDTARIVSATWLIAGFLLGLAGCVLALSLSSFAPTFGDDYLFVIFSAVILGGIGQPYGTMLGALIVGLATEVSAAFFTSGYKTDIAFAIMILMLFVRPQGLIAARSRQLP